MRNYSFFYLKCTIACICCVKLISYSLYCHLEQSSGCLGCAVRPKLISSLDDPLEGQNNHAWKTPKATLSEDFWTTSMCEMDNSAGKSCGSMSSTSTLTQLHDGLDAGCSSKPSELVNHGKFIRD